MNIQHAPHFNREKVTEHYSKKDGVPVKYVCTSALGGEAQSMDIYYRETPHPEFGNKYFGLYQHPIENHLMITNADKIEGAEFAMIQDKDGKYWYSSHRHDCLFIDGGMIDGGRSYVRTNGCDTTLFKVENGEMKCLMNVT
jgi:hypothetical protein